MGGVNMMMHGAGWMEGGLQASLAKMVLDADLLHMVSSMMDPVIVDERARLARVVSQEMQDGALPATDAEFLASAMIGVCFEVAVLMVERSPIDIDGATEFVANLFVGFFERVARTPGSKDRRLIEKVAE